MHILQLISEWIIVVPFFTGLLLFRRLKLDSRIIFFIVCAAFTPQLATTFLKNIDKTTLNILYNLYTPIEFFCFLYFFTTKLKWNTVFYLVSFIVLGISLYFFYYFGLKNKVLYELICLVNLLYVFFIFYYFLKMFRNDTYVFSVKEPFNWYILGLLLYAPCTFFLFADYLNTSANLHHGKSTLWIIHNIFNITLYITFTIGFLKERKQTTTT